METIEPRPSPQGPVSRDDCGLWMKMDPDPVTGSPLGNRREEPRARPPGAIPRFCSVMDGEVFIPPPPTHTAPVPAAEGSADAQVNDSSVTLTNEAAGATEAEDNPGGLDRHSGERRSMATRDEADEVIVSTEQTSTASMDATSLSKDAILPGDQEHTSMEDAGSDPTGTHHEGDGESDEKPEDVGILSGETCRESEAQKNNYPKEEPLGNSEHETQFDEEGESEDVCGAAETDSKLTTENADCGDVETNAPASDDEELCKAGQPQVQDVPAGESNSDEEHVDTRSLNDTLTKSSWARRESGTGETRASRLSFSGGAEQMATKDEQGDGGRGISIGIQRGERLLQRLQLVQLRQDVGTPESPRAAEQDNQETRGERLRTEVDEGAGTKVDEGAGTDLMAKTEKDEGKDVEAKARRSSSTTPEESEPRESDSDGRRVPADLPQMDPDETASTQMPFLSFRRRLSVDETCVERQVLLEDRHLQRVGGVVVNLADDPDVLEIPFKNDILLEPFTANEGPDRRGDDEWPFSEHKMKEIRQETRRELVLFNQGKIPGESSKGEDRQLKETKLLFEGFQMDNVEGPSRHRKPPPKGRVDPSVLERTRSLEMLSLKVCSFSRAHSLRLYRETETRAETVRPTTPTGSRDATPPSLNAKRDKLEHLCRSMDSISTSVSTGDTRRESGEGIGPQESPVLGGNPFFKLRPALGLKPEVEKDIREAKEREEELQRQRRTLYGENRRSGGDGETPRDKPALVPDVRKRSWGKLERVWPPPAKKDEARTEQQEPKVPRAGGQRAPLWERWESGLINGKTAK